jgi:hypothetical protein
MSALGHKQTCALQQAMTPNSDREGEIPQKAMSALPPKADMCGAKRNVRFGPEAEATRFHIVVPESGHSALIENITC